MDFKNVYIHLDLEVLDKFELHFQCFAQTLALYA